MTKERLKQLKALRKEADHIEKQIKTPPSRKEYVADFANDYSSGFARTFTITGYGQENYAKLRHQLHEKYRAIQREILELEAWLGKVEDPELRDILRMQYIAGLTQEAVAEELGYSVRTIKRKLQGFWKDVL